MSEKTTKEPNKKSVNRAISRRSLLQTATMAGTGLSLGGFSLGTMSSSVRASSTCSTIDDFEDSDFAEYRFDRGSSGASIVTDPTLNGTSTLEISGTNTEMISTSGLDDYPVAGDAFTYWIRGKGGADDVNLTYGVQDHDNRYFVRVDFANNDLFLFRYENGTSYQLAEDATVSLAEDTWYEVEVDWQSDGTHIVTLFDVTRNQIAQVSAVDSTWTSGGVGYDAYLGDGGTAYFDHISIGPCDADDCNQSHVVDNFEDGDLAEYSFDRGSSGASIVTEPVYSGSNALAISGTATEMISTSGLRTYPSAGEVFTYRVRATGGADDVNLTYGVQDHDNRYFVRVDFANNDLFLFRYENGTSYQLAENASVSLAEDTWYEVEVDWQSDGTHVVTLLDTDRRAEVAQISAVDSTWTSGGVGYDAYLADGGTAYFNDTSIGECDSRVTGDLNSVIDDFEDGDLAEYSFDRGSSGASTVSTPSYEGSASLEISGTNTEMISTSGLANYPEEGDVFTYRVRATGGADDVNLTYGVQDHDNRYLVRVDFNDDDFEIWRHEGGQSYVLGSQTSGFTLEEDTWYEVEVNWTSDSHDATLFANNGTKLASTSGTDSTWTSGGVGYDAYLGDGGTAYFDGVILGEANARDQESGSTIDDFEDGDLAEYSFDRGSSGASIVTEPVYSGSNALAISGTNTEMISTSGLANYPSAGDVFSYWVRPTGGADDVNLTYGVQDHDNRYFVRVDFTADELRLYRYENASSTKLEEDTATKRLTEDDWYQVRVNWRTNNDHVVTLRDSNGTTLAELASEDATWTSGGIGYDAYLGSSSGTVYFDGVTFASQYDGVDIETVATHDGDTKAYVRHDPSSDTLRLLIKDAGQISEASGIDQMPCHLEWNPSGDRLVFSMGGEIYVADLNGDTKRITSGSTDAMPIFYNEDLLFNRDGDTKKVTNQAEALDTSTTTMATIKDIPFSISHVTTNQGVTQPVARDCCHYSSGGGA